MRKNKILTAMLVFAAIGSCAHAENFAKQTLQATLPAYVDIQAQEGVLKENIDPATGQLSNAFNSVFKIRSNDNLDLYLRAETIADTKGAVDGFFQKGDTVYVILGHTTVKPNEAAIADIKSGNATPENNQNAIAYPVTGVQLSGKYTKEPVFAQDKARYEFSVEQGETVATTTISPNVDQSTYSYRDKAGNYEAYIILTDTTT